MAYLIDSDWTIDNLNQVPEAVALLASLAEEASFISVITYLEAFHGTLRDDDFARANAVLQRFTLVVPILDVTRGVAEHYARLRELLGTRGRRIESRAFDLLIAATAIEHDLTLVTRNVRDYADIPGLKLHETPQA